MHVGAKKEGKKGVSGKAQHNSKGSYNNHQLQRRGLRPGYIGPPRGNGSGQSFEGRR